MHKKLLLAILSCSASLAYAGGTFTRDNGAEPFSLDPQIASESAGGHVLFDTFEGLTTFGPEGKVIPGAAEKWETSEDGKTWTFHLRKNGQWSDGTPVTAEDFVYAWQRAVNPAFGSTYAFILFPVKNAEAINSGKIKDLNQLGIKALDKYTVQVTLDHPTPYFLQLLLHYTALPVPKHVVEKWGKDWTKPEHVVSNGPFHIVEWKPQSRIVAAKSDHYWDKDDVKLDKVIYYPIEDSNSALSRYRAGELDYSSVPTSKIDWAKQELKSQLHIKPLLSTYYYGFNLTQPPFKDQPKLRRALSMAVDRQLLIDKVMKSGQIPAYNIIPPGTDNAKVYEPDWSKWPRAKQIAEAKKLYAEAGYSKAHPFRFNLLYNTSEGHKKIAIAITSMWKSILGVEAKMENQEWKVMLANVKAFKDQMFRSGWNGDYNDPYTFLELFQSGAGENSTGFANKTFDGLLKKAAAESDLTARAQTLYEADKVLTDSDAIIPIYHYTQVYLLKPYVKGANRNIMGVLPSRYVDIQK